MTMAIFRDMMGVGSDEEFEKSVADIRTSLPKPLPDKPYRSMKRA